jgi:hypothetical protein
LQSEASFMLWLDKTALGNHVREDVAH